MLVLGIDPGLVTTGYGLIQVKNNSSSIIDYGTISPKQSDSLSQRLNTIYEDVSYIINKYKPNIMAIEEVFYGKNVKSALRLGHARGVSMVCASKNNISVYEYSARKVKQSITGNGAAHKSQVQFMIIKEFNLGNIKFSTDASDAIAIALCHINQIKLGELW